MEFKWVHEEINELESNRNYLSDRGEQTLAQFKELLKQRNEMLETLKMFTDFPDEDFKEEESNNYYTFSVKVSDMIKAKQLIEEATKID